MKRCANLYRVSTTKQVDIVKDDIPMQRIACREFAEKMGWTIVIEKEEKGVSGFKVSASKRDAIQELKESALNGEFDVLLVFMFDRLGRIENETPFVLEWFSQHGIEVWSVNEGQQRFEQHVDKLMNYIRFWQASGESEKTSIRRRFCQCPQTARHKWHPAYTRYNARRRISSPRNTAYQTIPWSPPRGAGALHFRASDAQAFRRSRHRRAD